MSKVDLLPKPWVRPFVTPMVQEAHIWASKLVAGGHTGGVIFAPQRTGKTQLIQLLCHYLESFEGPRGPNEPIESATTWVTARDRKSVREGPFWTWLLYSLKSAVSEKGSVTDKRNRTYDLLKDKAARCRSGRLIHFVDEAQFLDQTELGWFADIFNELERDGFEYVLFLVGSYLLGGWRDKLYNSSQQHVSERFFMNEFELHGLRSITEFEKCLARYDVDGIEIGGKTSYTEFYQPEWYRSGGRLAGLADQFYAAFSAIANEGKVKLEVPMAYFVRAVLRVLVWGEMNGGTEAFRSVVLDTKFHVHLSELRRQGSGAASKAA